MGFLLTHRIFVHYNKPLNGLLLQMREQETMAFEKKYGIKTSFIRGGTGTILAKIDAEKDNPQGDVWYGGTLDPHSQAGEMGLLEAYKSANLAHRVLCTTINN